MTITVVAYPYATATGAIDVPDGLSKEECLDYVKEHFNNIDFSGPELDYCGTDFDIYRDEAGGDWDAVFDAAFSTEPTPTKPSARAAYRYEVNIGGGCATGSVFVDEGASDDEIRLAIMDDLYGVYYEREKV